MAMWKLFGLIPRAKTLSPEEFHDYYRHPHGTVGMSISSLCHYVQNHQIDTDLLGETQRRFEAVAELSFSNEIDVIQPERTLPKLPVARAIWLPKPSLKVAAAAWIYAGGAHHTSFSQALTMEHLEDFTEIAGIELIRINAETRIAQFRQLLRWEEVAYGRNN